MKAKTASHRILLLASVLAATGCAVLTVDVDVYKGPLANHQDVQTEQMAAMAIGAKPLLVELRDRLEVQECWEPGDPNEGYDPNKLYNCYDYIRDLREKPWYVADYVRPYVDSEKGRKGFTGSNAVTVNNVLSLYKNRMPKEYTELLDRARFALEDYKQAYAILRPESITADKALWPEANANAASIADPNQNRLIKAYKAFLTEEKRDALSVLEHSLPWLDGAKGKHEGARNLRENDLSVDNDQALKTVSNAAFHALATTKLVELQAKLIFRLTGDKKKRFVGRITQIAQAYLDARKALEELWLVSIETITYLGLSGQIGEDSNVAVIPIVTLSLEIIQPRYLAVLLDNEKDPNIRITVTNLHRHIGAYPKADPNVKNSEWSFDRMKSVLRKRLLENPIETTKNLLTIHKFTKDTLNPSVSSLKSFVKSGPLKSLAYKAGWEFGLVRAPYLDPSLDDVRTITRTAEKVFADAGGAFAAGRLDKGLETLIEEYLNAAADDTIREDKKEFARRQLSDALVRFAQKVLFVANNDSLISPPKQAGFATGLASVSVRAVLGDKTWESWSKNSYDTAAYTRVLQAVGNSILVQADALHQERKHRERLEGHYKKEAAILNDTLRRMSPDHGDAIKITPVDSKLPSGTHTAKDVRDVWIELLEYEHDLALYYGETQRASEIAQALDAAREKRAGMVHIRPAMAYLRTSFPATSLQQNPNLTWDNMLDDHMMRSIPFSAQLHDLLDPKAKRDARINAEIDKQFWQNINRVRVAGGGNTNYVIAKDDIGNWYVKNYSADPCDVIKSAKNLAMFSLGAQIGNGLPGRLGGIEGMKQAKSGSALDASPLGRLFARRTAAYTEHTKRDYDLLREMLEDERTGIEARITKIWDENEDIKADGGPNTVDVIKPLKSELQKVSCTYLKELPERTSERCLF